jgi:multidrug efflux pump subunit AcrA (membrane-fusion protein)
MTSRFSRWTLGLLVALVAVGISFGSASAAPANKPATPKPANAALARTYKFEQNRLKIQAMRLKNADLYAGKIDGLITKLKAKGRDTAALEQAVAAFRTDIAQARAEWQAAEAILATHAGFDNDGKVTNADQARATLKDAHSHMQQARTIAHHAYEKLHAAIVAYRKAHREVKEPVAPPQP